MSGKANILDIVKQAPAIHIPREHQSAPKDRPIETAMKGALREMHKGTYNPEPVLTENVFGQMEDEFFTTGTEALFNHPRVAEAMLQLQKETDDRQTNEYLEKAEMLHEINCQIRAGHKWEGQARWQGKENEEMRLVNPITAGRFIEMLEAAGIRADVVPSVKKEIKPDPATGRPRWFETESSNALICLGRKVIRDHVGLYAWVDGEYKYVNRLQVPYGPEWTVMRFDEYDLPSNEKYHGWRTAVLALITQRVITEREAELAFGKVVENAASAFYRQQLFEFRNRQEKA